MPSKLNVVIFSITIVVLTGVGCSVQKWNPFKKNTEPTTSTSTIQTSLNSSTQTTTEYQEVTQIVLEKNIELDKDNDRLMSHDEDRFGTDPNNADSDYDGYSDYDELVSGYNPLIGNGALITVDQKNTIASYPIEKALTQEELANEMANNPEYKEAFESLLTEAKEAQKQIEESIKKTESEETQTKEIIVKNLPAFCAEQIEKSKENYKIGLFYPIGKDYHFFWKNETCYLIAAQTNSNPKFSNWAKENYPPDNRWDQIVLKLHNLKTGVEEKEIIIYTEFNMPDPNDFWANPKQYSEGKNLDDFLYSKNLDQINSYIQELYKEYGVSASNKYELINRKYE